MKRTKICILPKLNDCGGDAKKQWFVYYSYRNPADNNMVRFRLYDGFTECRTKKAKYAHAEKLIAEYSHRLQLGWNPFEEGTKAIYDDNLQYASVARVFKSARAGNKTFNYYSNLFLPEVKGMAVKTYRNYVSKYRMFDSWLTKEGYSGNDLSTISPETVQQFFRFLINDEQLAKITVTKYKHMLDRFFDWCVKKKYLRSSPMIDIPTTTRQNDQAPRPILEEDINLLVDGIKKDEQLWLAVQLEYYCFMRPVEIRYARISWFDLSRSKIFVPKNLITDRDSKTKESKTIIIPSQLREHLMKKWKIQLIPKDYFLIGQNGLPGPKHLGENNLRNRFNIIRDELELPKMYKFYSPKHTGNARTADAGFSMYDRQRQNGHASSRSTEEYVKNKIGFTSEDLQYNFPSFD